MMERFIEAGGDLYRADRLDKPLRVNYATYDMKKHGLNAIKTFIRQPYAWPGGYELVGLTSDGACLCHKCARENYRLVASKDAGWEIVAVDSTANTDDEVICDNCYRVIK